MRISDWSSDVCSSDLVCGPLHDHSPPLPLRHRRRPTVYSRHDRQSTASKRPLVDALFTLEKTRRRRAADGQDLSSILTGVQRDIGLLRRQTLREDSSMKLLLAKIASLCTLISQPLRADDGVSKPNIISEAEFGAISENNNTDPHTQP